MSFNLFLTPGTTPSGASLPGNAQALVNFIAQYVLISGDQNIGGINFGSDTPPPENRGFPWWRTDSDGNPMGMYNWNGSAWVTVSTAIANGPTSNRPLDPVTGTFYLDTSINVLLMFERGQWRTADGSPGDVKDVKASTLAAALLKNPGWAQDPDSLGRVVGGAGDGAGLTSRAYGDSVGAETVVLTENQLARHSHSPIKLEGSNQDIGDPGPLVLTNTAQDNGQQEITNSETGVAGNDEAHPNMQPTVFYWKLYKL